MINLLLAIHCHQPVGNFGGVFQEAFERAYEPFIDILERHPKIKLSLHYSGSLLDWLEERQPEFLNRIAKLVRNSQVEIICGGYYEPILILIPESDALAQIKMHKDKIKELFYFNPRGIWTTERIWEPRLPAILSKAGIDFTIIDDSHFKLVGRDPERLSGFYVTEEEGNKLFIFPGSEKLRYSIPFKLPEETINYLRSRANQEETTITYGDDGEKFGLWPGTNKWVYKDKWLENFFSKLEENNSWINLMTFNEYISSHRPIDRVYLTCASYREMMEWSGGFYRNFLVKYPEANNMHKKMLYVSNKINDLDSPSPKGKTKSAKTKKILQARKELMKAQANDAYWHGVFGGLYLNHLRSAVYKHLIEAEKIIDETIYKDHYAQSEFIDFDCDGKEEIIVNTKNQNLIFRPLEGATMSFWAFKPRSLNLINTLARRYESYHEKIKASSKSSDGAVVSETQPKSIHDIAGIKESGLEEFLFYDRYPKYCLLDYFLKSQTSLSDFLTNRFSESGNFINKFYKPKINKKKRDLEIYFSSMAEIDGCPVKLIKNIKINDKGLVLDYKLENLQTNKKLSSIFGIELNLSVYDPSLNEAAELKDIRDFKIHDIWNQLKLIFNFDQNTNIWHFPVETISDSESGIEKTYQQLCFLAWVNLELESNKAWLNSIQINID